MAGCPHGIEDITIYRSHTERSPTVAVAFRPGMQMPACMMLTAVAAAAAELDST